MAAIEDELWAEIVKDYFAMADGVLFTGGLAYPPSLYGEKPHATVQEQSQERTGADFKLMELARPSQKPSLGICAGLQLLNIETGGGLIQHLDTAKDHVRAAQNDSSHPVELLPGTQLADLFGSRHLTVNSAHHQAANPARLGRELKVSALAPDGTIEALELERQDGRFFVFVQRHPERLADAEHRRKLFSAFIDASRR